MKLGENYDEKKNTCWLCQSKKIRKLFTDFRNNHIWACDDCNLQFMNPQYSNQYLQDFYTNYGTGSNYKLWEEPSYFGHRQYFSIIESVIGKSYSEKSLFDFGCGDGTLINTARTLGWDIEGYDVDPTQTKAVADRLLCPVHTGDFFNLNLNKKFQLVTMHQVLEHLKDPLRYLEKLKSLLLPRGYIFIAVPNIDSSSNRYKKFIGKWGGRKNKLGSYYDSDHHLFYYTKETLAKLLTTNGFEILKIGNGHKIYPNQPRINREIYQKLIAPYFSNSTFTMIGRLK